jgi:hypothetical protein
MRLDHIGIVVRTDGIDQAIGRYEQLGYKMSMRIRRDEPWIGKIVGRQGADIEIVHMRRDDDPVGVELLAYYSSDRPHPGTQHMAFWVDEMPSMSFWSIKLGEDEIPDGPNKGVRCSYWSSECGDIVELMVKPEGLGPEGTQESPMIEP